jgi:hypothetical protein
MYSEGYLEPTAAAVAVIGGEFATRRYLRGKTRRQLTPSECSIENYEGCDHLINIKTSA